MAIADERHHLPSNSNARNKQRLNLGAWNVRTTNDSDFSIRPERATALICRELEKASIDICALSEVRRPGTRNIGERSHTIFWSGGEERTAGIGFAVSNLLATQGISPTPISDRLMSMRIQLKGGDNLTFISVYPPAIQRPQEEKEQFYECVSAAEMDSVIILGDCNACVASDWKSWPNVIGKHGVGKMNSNGLILLEFCTRFQLSFSLHDVPTETQLKEHMAAPSFKTLASARPCTIQHGCTVICYTDKRQSCSKLLH